MNGTAERHTNATPRHPEQHAALAELEATKVAQSAAVAVFLTWLGLSRDEAEGLLAEMDRGSLAYKMNGRELAEWLMEQLVRLEPMEVRSTL